MLVLVNQYEKGLKCTRKLVSHLTIHGTVVECNISLLQKLIWKTELRSNNC